MEALPKRWVSLTKTWMGSFIQLTDWKEGGLGKWAQWTFSVLKGLGWQANTANIATNITIGVASCLPLSINSSACWVRCFSWPQVGTVLEVVAWVRWRRQDGAEYSWTRSACLSWSARCLKRCTSGEASGEGSLALWLFFSTLSGPDSTSFWSLYLPSVPDSRTPGISVTSGVFVILEISWDWTCRISLSGI